MTPIKAVFFDLDGTLVDDGSNWHRSVSATANAVTDRHMHIDADELEAAYFKASEVEWGIVQTVTSYPWGNMDAESIPRKIWGEALKQVGASDESIATMAAETYVRLRNTNVPTYPDTADCIAAISAGYRLGLITNGFESTQRPKLESTGVAHHFESITTTDIGSGKPNPAIFWHGLDTLGVQPQESVYVGDGITWDVGGANNVGMLSVWLNRNGTQRSDADPTPDAEITTLSELPAVVSSLSSR